MICSCGTAMNVIGKMTVSSPTTGGAYDTPIYRCPQCRQQVADMVTIDHSTLKCYDCGFKYGSAGWMDALVSDEVWHQISPSKDEGGILCISCIARRCSEAGLQDVPVSIVSGSLVNGRVAGIKPIRVEALSE